MAKDNDLSAVQGCDKLDKGIVNFTVSPSQNTCTDASRDSNTFAELSSHSFGVTRTHSGERQRKHRSSSNVDSDSGNRVRHIRSSVINAGVPHSHFSLDPRAGLKAFRLIGGLDGITIDELQEAAKKVRDDNIRFTLENNLEEIFTSFDADADGILDIMEFENMVQSSTIVEQAVYELLERAEDEEQREYLSDERNPALNSHYREHTFLDISCVVSTSMYFVFLALQTDLSPNWHGWHYFEVFFLLAFSWEIMLRYYLVYRSRAFKIDCWPFVITCFDTLVTLMGWLEMCIVFSSSYDSSTVLSNLRWLRICRIARCTRMIRIFWYCQDLRVLIEGIFSGLKSAFWGLTLIVLLVFVWAVTLRMVISNDWSAEDPVLVDSMSSTPETMLVVFRCMALSADTSCVDSDQRSLFLTLSRKFGGFFSILWLLSEIFILIGVLNVVASVFVVQAAENATRIKESINKASLQDDLLNLQKFDKLLRTLIHPGREYTNPKDKKATEVAMMLRIEHPEAVAAIPNLEAQLVHFAKHIQDAKKMHQSAMDIYEASEVKECRKLRSVPSAKTYIVDGEEKLLVSDLANWSNCLSLPMAPMGSVEMMLVQGQDRLEVLVKEAAEAQEFLKSIIYPHSDWKLKLGAGETGDIWKASKGLCDEAFDPGLKSYERIEQKVHRKYNGRYNRNRDYSRLSLIYNSVGHMLQAIPKFLQYRFSEEGFQVVTLENRFLKPHALGWRDVTMLVKVRLSQAVGRRSLTETYHIMELQLRLKELTVVCHESHKLYEKIRAHLPDDVVTKILDRLVTDTTLDLGITKSEWLQCLPNKEVKRLLDALGIPKRILKSLFDIIDIDASGTVTSSELQEMLRLVKDPVHAHELTGCHLRVRDIQRQIQARIEPKLSSMHTLALRRMENFEQLLGDILDKLNIRSTVASEGDATDSLPGSDIFCTPDEESNRGTVCLECELNVRHRLPPAPLCSPRGSPRDASPPTPRVATPCSTPTETPREMKSPRDQDQAEI